jgi:hypothetical protein
LLAWRFVMECCKKMKPDKYSARLSHGKRIV